jgi:hypothetical protein
MPIVDNIIGIVRGINDRKKAAQVQDIMAGNGDPTQNYLNNPQAVAQNLMSVDAFAGITASREATDRATAQAKARRDAAAADMVTLGKHLRGLDPTKTDYRQVVGTLAPYLTGTLGMKQEDLDAFATSVQSNPMLLQGMDDEAWKAIAADRYGEKVATPGSFIRRGGETVERVPFAMKVENTPDGAIGRVFDPNVGEFVDGPRQPAPATGAPAGAPASMPTSGSAEFSAAFGTPAAAAPASAPQGNFTVEQLLPHFVGQESSDDYTALNPESGAMGRYQIMPEVGQVFAQRLGLAWRPDMMTQDTPAARRYQDAIGQARIQESIDYGKGNLDEITGHYFAGTDRSGWGPKTRQYQQEMRQRIGGGDASMAGQPQAQPPQLGRYTTINPKDPTASDGKDYRVATPEEVAAMGFAPGTVVQIDQNNKADVLQSPPKPTLTGKQRENATTKLASLTAIETQLNRVEELIPALEKGGWTGYLGGLVPGALDKESDAYDAALATLTSLTRQLTRTPGEGSMSDYETRLAAAIPPGRRMGPEGRDESILAMRALIKATRDGYQELLSDGAPQGQQGPNIGDVIRNPTTGERRRWDGKEWRTIK